MPPLPTIVETRRSHFHMNRWYAVALIGASAVLAGYSVLYIYIPSAFQEIEVLEQMPIKKESVPEELNGKLYMSLAPTASTEHYSQTLFTYDVGTSAFDQLIPAAKREYLTSKISPDGERIVFASISEVNDKMQLLLGDRLMKDLAEIGADVELAIKRNPTWSPDGAKIVFSGKTDEGGGELDVKKWGVYAYDIASASTSLITHGTNPVFLPDGALAVLKTDGIYRIDMTDISEVRILEAVNGVAESNVTFDVSRDGKRIVWAMPDVSLLRFIDVVSWQPFISSTTADVFANVFWPVFSPGGEYVAMQEFDWNSEEGAGSQLVQQRLTMYSLRDGSRMALLDLTPFYQNRTFLTDWR